MEMKVIKKFVTGCDRIPLKYRINQEDGKSLMSPISARRFEDITKPIPGTDIIIFNLRSCPLR